MKNVLDETKKQIAGIPMTHDELYKHLKMVCEPICQVVRTSNIIKIMDEHNLYLVDFIVKYDNVPSKGLYMAGKIKNDYTVCDRNYKVVVAWDKNCFVDLNNDSEVKLGVGKIIKRLKELKYKKRLAKIKEDF